MHDGMDLDCMDRHWTAERANYFAFRAEHGAGAHLQSPPRQAGRWRSAPRRRRRVAVARLVVVRGDLQGEDKRGYHLQLYY